LKDTGKMRILIAEDDTALAGFVRKGLEAEHYAVDVSNDGEQARALATELDYDLLVLDLNLPRLDGVNILRRVRAEKPNLPVVVLTARGRVDDRVMCLDAGADDYVVKPFFFFRTFCSDPGFVAPKPFAVRVAAGGGRSQTGPRGTESDARDTHD
jgi:CheY-like chemotaxis protein